MTAHGRWRDADRGGSGDDATASPDQREPRENSGMDAGRFVIVGRFGRWWLWCALGATLALGPGAASAQDSGGNPCSNTHAQPIPDCQPQPNSFPQPFQPKATHVMGFSCTGDHPFYYPFNGGFAVVDPDICWSSTEEPGSSTKEFIGEFTNNCSSDEQLLVGLACSDTPPPPSD